MNRLEWILGIFLVVLLLVVLGLAIMLWTQPRGTPTAPSAGGPAGLAVATPIFVGKTAQAAFGEAEAMAHEWQADAVLLRADATWPPGLFMQDLLDGASTWSFIFYSPAAGAIQQVTVIEERVTLLAERSYRPQQPPLATSAWAVDSHTAVQTLMMNGGQDFLRLSNDAVLSLSLRTDAPNGRITWSATLAATETSRSLLMDIDAQTGDVLDTYQNQ